MEAIDFEFKNFVTMGLLPNNHTLFSDQPYDIVIKTTFNDRFH